jgi:hypothetical protein
VIRDEAIGSQPSEKRSDKRSDNRGSAMTDKTTLSLKQQIINQNLFSETYMPYSGKEVYLPDFDEDFYIKFMETLIFSKSV